MSKRVIVIGGGIAGLSAAHYLSQEGIKVSLIEKSCFLGGLAAGFTCKATDRCQQCGACLVEEMLKKVTEDPSIDVYLNTEVESMKKEKGFRVKLKKSSASFNYSSNISKGFSKYNFPLYVVKKKTSDSPKDAVIVDDIGYEGELFVDAVILATGFTPFDPLLRPTYGYGMWKNIITALDLEHMLREKCTVLRPSDGKVAKKLAFIQCVGSRSKEFNTLWCSEVCCPYALRMASVIKLKYPDSEIWVFFIDLQNVGKEYSSFLKEVKTKVKFVNAIPIDIIEGENSTPKVVFKDDRDTRKEEEFDLVILSVGISPNRDNRKLSQITKVEIDEDGFLKPKSMFEPCSTSVEGIFLAGTVTGPKNITDTISHAKSVVGQTLTYLGG